MENVIYSLKVTDQNGCSFTVPFNVRVITRLQVSAEKKDAGCKGDSIGSITLTVGEGLPPYTIVWSNGSTASGIKGLKAGDYAVSVTDSFGQTVTKEISIMDYDEIKTLVSSAICQGEVYAVGERRYSLPGNYSDTLISRSGCDSIVNLILSVNKSFSDTVSASVCDGNPFLFMGNSYTTGGYYPHKLKTNLGCDSIITLSLTVNALPVKPVISIQADTLTSSASQNQWYLNGEIIEGADKQKLVIAKSGSYQVYAINDYGCRNPSETVMVIYSNIGIQSANTLTCTLFPNPNDGQFTVRLTGASREKISLLIIDMNGRIHRILSVNHFLGEHTELIQSDLASGAYTLRMITGNEVLNRQFIVK